MHNRARPCLTDERKIRAGSPRDRRHQKMGAGIAVHVREGRSHNGRLSPPTYNLAHSPEVQRPLMRTENTKSGLLLCASHCAMLCAD